MKVLLTILFFVTNVIAFSQEAEVTKSMKEFHQLLVTQNPALDKYIHEKISYGHSNGWIESKKDMVKNLANGYIIYYSYKEDSIQVEVDHEVAQARFVADIEASVNGKRSTFHLKVLEIWVKQKKQWWLFARQAVKG